MAKQQRFRTYIKEWRLMRGLSVRKLAQRIESEPGIELLSYASLSRIENGDQPCDLDTLNAIAKALNVSPTMLLENNPTVEGEVVDLVRRMDPAKREIAIRMLKAM